MKKIEFNLLTEPWVRVRRPENTVQEVSLTDALLRCFHSLRDALYDCFSTDTAPHTHANVSTKHTVTASCAPRPP